MIISELINELRKTIKEHGDIRVVSMTDELGDISDPQVVIREDSYGEFAEIA